MMMMMIYIYIYTYIDVSCITLMTLDYGNYDIFLITGNAGLLASTLGTQTPDPRTLNTHD